MAQDPGTLRAKQEKRLLAVLENRLALLDEWKCPCCKREFRNQNACPHNWDDVRKSNEAFLLSYLRKRATV